MTTDPSQLPADDRFEPARTGEPAEPSASSADSDSTAPAAGTPQEPAGPPEAAEPERAPSDAQPEAAEPHAQAPGPEGQREPLPPERRKIQVGSRPPVAESRGRDAPESGPAKPGAQQPAADKAEPAGEPTDRGEPRAKAPKPSRRDPLSPEMERELESAMAGASMEELLATDAAVSAGAEPLEVESRHQATVVKIHGDNVFCSLGGRHEGVVSLRQFLEPPLIGAILEVVIRGYHAEDGLYEISVPGASVDVHDWSDLIEGSVIEVRITGSNAGGLECLVGNIRGFIPASQVELHRVEDFSEYIDQKLRCVVTEANERRRNLVLSHRDLLDRERQEERKKLLEELEVGQVREGVVSSIRDFGAFVDLGGVDGLVHISQLSWDRVNHPSEVLQAGQKVSVKVEKINRETGKIGLSYRDLLEHPWDHVEEQFAVDSTVKGTVTRIAKFGAFVKIAPGIEGLIHVSELAHHRVIQVSSVVREGEEVEVKVLSIDPENQRISLSLKAAHPLPEKDEPAEESEEPQESVVKQHRGPLRGGRESDSGGDQFGIRW